MLLTEADPRAGQVKATDVGQRLARQPGIQRFPTDDAEVFVLQNFLSPLTCERVLAIMEDSWRPSTIADDIGVENYRTSQTCTIDSTHPVIAEMEDRIAGLTGLNPMHGEPLQGQKYEVGEEFKEHTDYFEPDGPDYERFCAQTGQRTWTVMIYLNEPEAGGVTFFRNLGMGARPIAGTLLAWNNMTRTGSPNGATLHHGMPVEKGQKFILTKWFRERQWPWPEEVATRLRSGRRFDGEPSINARTRKVQREAAAAPIKPPPRPETEVDDRIALQRRNWALSVKQALMALDDAPGGGIRRVRGLSPDAFLRDYYAPGRPVIIEGEMAGWPALERWTPDYLKARVGSAPIEYQGNRNEDGLYELQKEVHRHTLPFDVFIDAIVRNAGNDAYVTANNSNRATLQCLFEDVRPLSNYLRGDPGMPWIGPRGTFTPLHFDLTNNMIAQVVGAKKFILLPPSETQKMCNHRHVFSAVHDIRDETMLRTYPQAREAISYEVELSAGELLFIPIGWWHQVTSLDFSVSFTFTDFRWKNDFYDSFPRD